MLFRNLNLEFSSGINLISGENSTGKTALIKFLYAYFKALLDSQKKGTISAEGRERIFVEKFQGVFRPEGKKIGRLVNRKHGGNAKTENEILLTSNVLMRCGFGNRQENHMELSIGDLKKAGVPKPVYIPPKEIISSTENFGSLYREYEIAFEETYADLCELLEKPLKKGKYTDEQNQVLESIGEILNGKVSQKNHKFYLSVKGAGTFEMGLVSEGYRKLSTIIYLIQSGSLDKNSIIFWDEPETNMNPKMIMPVAKSLTVLAKMGVQVFATTHSYFVQQAFEYLRRMDEEVHVKFFSLYHDGNEVYAEQRDTIADLEHNAIMEEFDAVYDREQELFYANDK
jgi:AAA15 family ATPase/GTPase